MQADVAMNDVLDRTLKCAKVPVMASPGFRAAYLEIGTHGQCLVGANTEMSSIATFTLFIFYLLSDLAKAPIFKIGRAHV